MHDPFPLSTPAARWSALKKDAQTARLLMADLRLCLQRLHVHCACPPQDPRLPKSLRTLLEQVQRDLVDLFSTWYRGLG